VAVDAPPHPSAHKTRAGGPVRRGAQDVSRYCAFRPSTRWGWPQPGPAP